MALMANDVDSYKSWLELCIQELGRDTAGEIESEWKVLWLIETERGGVDGLVVERELLTRFGDWLAEKTTRISDSDCVCFRNRQ